MTNISKHVSRACSLIQLPGALVWCLSLLALLIAALSGVQWLGVGAAIVFLASMVVVGAAIFIEMSLVYRTFDGEKRMWTTAWGHTFVEDHMPGRAAHE